MTNNEKTNNENKNDLNVDDIRAFVEKYEESMLEGRPIASRDDIDIEQVKEFIKNYDDNANLDEEEFRDVVVDSEEKDMLSAIKGFFVNEKETSDEWESKLNQSRKYIENLLPNGNVRPLYTSEECLLCKGERKRKRTCYAVTDIGHTKPEGTKVSALGIRVKTKVGSMIPLQIACCDTCKSKIRFASFFRIGFMTIATTLALFVLSRPSIVQALTNIHQLIPLLGFLIWLPLAWLISTLILKSYIKSNKDKVIFNIFEIPFASELKNLGWFILYSNDDVTRLVFSKERLKGDWFTK